MFRCILFVVGNLDEQRATKLVSSGISANRVTERAERLPIPPVYSLRGIRAYDKLQIVVTEVRQVRRLQYSVIRERTNTHVGVQVSCQLIHAT